MWRVERSWRYPVKSMSGEEVDVLDLVAGGVHGDRLWALRDVERDVPASARRLPAMLHLRARYLTPPGPGAGPGAVPPVVITLVDGTEISSQDPEVHGVLSSALDRDVRLEALRGETAQHRLGWRERVRMVRDAARDLAVAPDERLPDLSRIAPSALVLARYSTPPGAFVDLSPLHVLTTPSLRTLGRELGEDVDPRRFRPNVLLGRSPGDDEGDPLPEASWTGADLHLGPARARVTMSTVRCVVPSRAQPGLAVDPRVSRAVAKVAGRYLGVYADVAQTGPVAVGDAVRVSRPAPPGRVDRAAAAALGSTLRGATRVIDVGRSRLARPDRS